jgi:hypothetical protein
MINVLIQEPPNVQYLLLQSLKHVLLPCKLEELTLLLISDVPEQENSSQPKKIVYHVSAIKSKREDGIGYNAHQLFEHRFK